MCLLDQSPNQSPEPNRFLGLGGLRPLAPCQTAFVFLVLRFQIASPRAAQFTQSDEIWLPEWSDGMGERSGAQSRSRGYLGASQSAGLLN
jgi:hypothetical protein